jgi:tetratricopeptide (TPR) repeat protein
LAAALWAVHPLQTESVTCVVQRNEVFAALFQLLTLWLFVRGTAAARPAPWFISSIIACAAGIACKEVMVAAPVIVLLYDRTFVSGSFRAAWRRHGPVYLGLAATWLLLAALIAGSPHRAGTVGFGVGVSPWQYLLTQCHALVLYLRLSFWPHPLVVDYGTWLAPDIGAVAGAGVLIAGLLAATVWTLWRRPRLGFFGGCFFLILAPSSSFVPLASQTMAEHRMYLPLAAVLGVAILGAWRIFGSRSLVGLAVAIPLAAVATARRNEVYASELSLWTDTVAHRPDNARARVNLGYVLQTLGRTPEAIASYEAATRLPGSSAEAHSNLANLYLKRREIDAGLTHGAEAVRLDARDANARVNFGLALIAASRPHEAVVQLEAAQYLDPAAADIHAYLGSALLLDDRADAALVHLKLAAAAEHVAPETWLDLARAAQRVGDAAPAREACARALQLRPDFADAHYVGGNLAAAAGDFDAAIEHYRRALAIAPATVGARNNLANVLLLTGRRSEAIAEYRAILREHPDDKSVQENLSRALQASPGLNP